MCPKSFNLASFMNNNNSNHHHNNNKNDNDNYNNNNNKNNNYNNNNLYTVIFHDKSAIFHDEMHFTIR